MSTTSSFQYVILRLRDLWAKQGCAPPRATMLVNMSNTAWFGDSLAQPQHLQISQMRALDPGRPIFTLLVFAAIQRPFFRKTVE